MPLGVLGFSVAASKLGAFSERDAAYCFNHHVCMISTSFFFFFFTHDGLSGIEVLLSLEAFSSGLQGHTWVVKDTTIYIAWV